MGLILAVSLLESQTLASPRALPFTIPYRTNAAGQRSAEIALDLVPVRVATPSKPPVGDRYLYQGGFSYGVSSAVELDAMLAYEQNAAPLNPSLSFQGFRQHIQLRLTDPGRAAVDLGLILGASELFDRMESLQVLVLAKQIADFSVLANLRTEQRFRRGIEVDWVFSPSWGMTYRALSHLTVGIEYWAHGYWLGRELTTELDAADVAAFNSRPHDYVGPAVHLVWPGAFWCSVAGYLRKDELSREQRVGDHYGRFWIRTAFAIMM
jgi:hypothetical protein